MDQLGHDIIVGLVSALFAGISSLTALWFMRGQNNIKNKTVIIEADAEIIKAKAQATVNDSLLSLELVKALTRTSESQAALTTSQAALATQIDRLATAQQETNRIHNLEQENERKRIQMRDDDLTEERKNQTQVLSQMSQFATNIETVNTTITNIVKDTDERSKKGIQQLVEAIGEISTATVKKEIQPVKDQLDQLLVKMCELVESLNTLSTSEKLNAQNLEGLVTKATAILDDLQKAKDTPADKPSEPAGV